MGKESSGHLMGQYLQGQETMLFSGGYYPEVSVYGSKEYIVSFYLSVVILAWSETKVCYKAFLNLPHLPFTSWGGIPPRFWRLSSTSVPLNHHCKFPHFPCLCFYAAISILMRVDWDGMAIWYFDLNAFSVLSQEAVKWSNERWNSTGP